MSADQPHVLVVEDEPAQREILVYNLEAEGFLVSRSDNGENALILVDEDMPDVIVLDWMMPRLSGIEVCRRLKSRAATRNIPVIMLSAKSEDVDRVRGLETGADDYVIKPFSPRELTARINAILRRTSSRGTASRDSADEVIQKGRLELLMERYLAKLDGKDLDLSRYEFGMLRIFMKHPGRVYSRDQLMELVWDEPEAALDRTVDAHIKTLRRKLHEIDSDFDPIKTHRGIGYSFSDD
jgi:two-component system phosphate regulon response regulator PhoB